MWRVLPTTEAQDSVTVDLPVGDDGIAIRIDLWPCSVGHVAKVTAWIQDRPGRRMCVWAALPGESEKTLAIERIAT